MRHVLSFSDFVCHFPDLSRPGSDSPRKAVQSRVVEAWFRDLSERKRIGIIAGSPVSETTGKGRGVKGGVLQGAMPSGCPPAWRIAELASVGPVGL